MKFLLILITILFAITCAQIRILAERIYAPRDNWYRAIRILTVLLPVLGFIAVIIV